MRARVCEGRAPWFLGVLTRPALSKKKIRKTEGLLPRVSAGYVRCLLRGLRERSGGIESWRRAKLRKATLLRGRWEEGTKWPLERCKGPAKECRGRFACDRVESNRIRNRGSQ